MTYTNKSFYVKSTDVEELHKFNKKCKKDGHSSGSKVIMEMIKLYNNNLIKVDL